MLKDVVKKERKAEKKGGGSRITAEVEYIPFETP
jgi:hypothetical protein